MSKHFQDDFEYPHTGTQLNQLNEFLEDLVQNGDRMCLRRKILAIQQFIENLENIDE